MTQNTTIFISYSHDSDAHRAFVLSLANQLRENGLECQIDQYINGFPPEGWLRWMEVQIKKADFVLIVCTHPYLQRYCGQYLEEGRGGNFEGLIISQTLYDNYHLNKKFIPVIPEHGSLDDVPMQLKGISTCYRLFEDYDKLYRVLTKQPPVKPPPIGPLIPMLPGYRPKQNHCPYRGISNFDVVHAEYFFGRTADIHKLKRKVLEDTSVPLISLFGATGIGKSSLVLAGLIPELKKEGNWEYRLFYPGNDPFNSLTSTLTALTNTNPDYVDTHLAEKGQELANKLKTRKNYLTQVLREVRSKYRNSNLLIIIDKFEEIYKESNGTKDDNVEKLDSPIQGFQFLECLIEGIRAINDQSQSRIVLLTISTSSGHDKSTSFPKYTDIIKLSQIGLYGLNEKQLYDVIERPAKKMKVDFEENLVGRIVRNAGEQPGILPLLEFALMQLWDKQENNLITTKAYERIGEIRGALIQYADDCLKEFTKAEKEIVRKVFIQLIDENNETLETEYLYPKVATRDELGEDKWAVVESLSQKRLLVIRSEGGHEVVEIAHKALIKHWPEVKNWLNESRSQRYVLQQINKRAKEWKKKGEKFKDVDTGKQLREIKNFDKDHHQDFPLPPLASQFYKKGRMLRRIKLAIISILLLSFVGSGGLVYVNYLHGEAEIARMRQAHFSSGETIYFTTRNEKRSGQKLFDKKHFLAAADSFKASLTKEPDDPEARIYMNNATALAKEDYLTIAISVPIGGNQDISKEMLRGIAQAQDELNNDGGINGKLLQIIIVNDNNDPELVVDLATDLATKRKEVLAIIGSNASDVSLNAAKVYQAHKLVMISPTSFALDFEEIPPGGYIFLAINSYKTLMPELVAYVKKSVKDPKLLVCYDSKAYDQKYFINAFKAKGITVVNDEKSLNCDFSRTEILDEIIRKVIGDGIVNSLFIAPHVNNVNEGAHLAELSQGKLNLFGSSTLYTAETLRQGKNIEGMVIPVHWHSEAFPEHPFYKKATDLWGEKARNGITWRSATTYDATQVIIKGLKEIKANTPSLYTRNALQQIIADNEFKMHGATGEIQFQASGERKGKESYLVEIRSCQACETGYDFAPL